MYAHVSSTKLIRNKVSEIIQNKTDTCIHVPYSKTNLRIDRQTDICRHAENTIILQHVAITENVD